MNSTLKMVSVIALILAFILTSCTMPTPVPQESEFATTTTTTEAITTTESTTTTTTAEDTTVTTTESTSEAIASATETLATDKTTQSTVSKTEKPTTTEKTTAKTTKSTTKKTTATTTEPDPYAPYEDNSLAPAKDKRCLLLNFSNEEIEMTFEKALVYPKDYDRLTWLYTGTTRNGTPYSCEVVADQERIFRITCDVEADSAMFKKDEALVCLKRFFKANKISCNFDKCGVLLSHSKAEVGPNGEILQKMSTYCTFQVPLYDDDVNRFKGRVNCRNGKLYVSELTAQTRTDEWIPGYSGDDIPLLIPRWKSE